MPRGGITAVILLSGKRQEVSGRFASDGAATNNIKRAGKPTVTVVCRQPIRSDLVNVTVDGDWERSFSRQALVCLCSAESRRSTSRSLRCCPYLAGGGA
jgi:hypothetical protein